MLLWKHLVTSHHHLQAHKAALENALEHFPTFDELIHFVLLRLAQGTIWMLEFSWHTAANSSHHRTNWRVHQFLSDVCRNFNSGLTRSSVLNCVSLCRHFLDWSKLINISLMATEPFLQMDAPDCSQCAVKLPLKHHKALQGFMLYVSVFLPLILPSSTLQPPL